MPKILVAEDEAFLLKMYRFNLEQEGFEVVIAENGEEAIATMEREQPDILLLDILMPKVDGFAVLDHVAKKKYVFPVIVLSNITREADDGKFDRYTLGDYFVKSDLDLPLLIARVKELLQEEKRHSDSGPGSNGLSPGATLASPKEASPEAGSALTMLGQTWIRLTQDGKAVG